MGQAILHGLSAEFPPENINGYDKDPSKAAALASMISVCKDAGSAASASDILIIAVKPAFVETVCSEIKAVMKPETIIISIAAGVTINSIENVLGKSKKIVRVMPNTPALINEGMTAISHNQSVDAADLAITEKIFSLIGKTLIIEEKYLDAVTAVSGCGPAYGFTFIQAMADAGVRLGLTRSDAVLLAAQTLKGAAEMVMNSADEPISLRNKVTSPGGSTIAAVHKLERAAFSGIIMDAVTEAAEISANLGKKK